MRAYGPRSQSVARRTSGVTCPPSGISRRASGAELNNHTEHPEALAPLKRMRSKPSRNSIGFTIFDAANSRLGFHILSSCK